MKKHQNRRTICPQLSHEQEPKWEKEGENPEVVTKGLWVTGQSLTCELDLHKIRILIPRIRALSKSRGGRFKEIEKTSLKIRTKVHYRICLKKRGVCFAKLL